MLTNITPVAPPCSKLCQAASSVGDAASVQAATEFIQSMHTVLVHAVGAPQTQRTCSKRKACPVFARIILCNQGHHTRRAPRVFSQARWQRAAPPAATWVSVHLSPPISTATASPRLPGPALPLRPPFLPCLAAWARLRHGSGRHTRQRMQTQMVQQTRAALRLLGKYAAPAVHPLGQGQKLRSHRQ